MGKNSNKDKKSLKAKLGKAADAEVVEEVKEAVKENTIVDPDAIQEAIQLEDREEGYNSSAQVEEEDALLKKFGF